MEGGVRATVGLSHGSRMLGGFDGCASMIANGPSKDLSKALTGRMQALSREARSNQRRLLTAFGVDTDSDLLKFNQLKVINFK